MSGMNELNKLDDYIDAKKSAINIIKKSVIGIGVLSLLLGTFYTVDEGHVGIVKRFGEAVEQVPPGLHFKIPIMDAIKSIEVRTRKNVESLSASTSEQMPIKAEVSINWTVDKANALTLFKEYGGLDQFELRILDPKLRSSSKSAISRFTAEQLIKERQEVVSAIELLLIEKMSGFSITMNSIQLENIVLPAKYINSIEAKQSALNLAEAEKHKLARQNLEAQRDVNIQKAKAEGINAVSIAKAAAIEREGIAEAKAIKAKANALKGNPLIVDLTRAQGWDGKYPTTMMGQTPSVLWNMSQVDK